MNKERSSPAGDRRAPFWFLGGQARILVPSTATGGSLSVMEFTDSKGHAPPLHVHEAEDEIWIVLDGEVTFFIGDDRHDLHAGAVAHGPRGVPHSYLVRSPNARLVVAFGPAGIETWFAANGSPIVDVNDAPAPFDIEAVIASAQAHRLRVTGPPPAA
ncbi:cupin [Sphaerisporangium rufum]|uniref:Cupin n=1 Tax=Sphaerisporangium rufum TaxID=1381558 RepID=A0A919R3E9_9ACTN|nr:cupin domain-containing protein [Sphaerisporangium rufum]GII78962.1 cupin [Sphaerisporangium rufum]